MLQFGGKPKKTSSDTKRHFTVVIGSKEHGLYVSSTPSSAAKKAVTKLCTANKSKKVEFYIREITQGSKKKTYGPYEGYIEKLKEPIELKGRVIKYKPVAKLSKKCSKKSVVKKREMKGGGDALPAPFVQYPGAPLPSAPNLDLINQINLPLLSAPRLENINERNNNCYIYYNFKIRNDKNNSIISSRFNNDEVLRGSHVLFKMTMQNFCDCNQIRGEIFGILESFNDYSLIRSYLIDMTRQQIKERSRCNFTDFVIRPETMLFIYINKNNSSVLEQLTTNRFHAKSRYVIFRRVDETYEFTYLPKRLNNAQSNMSQVN